MKTTIRKICREAFDLFNSKEWRKLCHFVVTFAVLFFIAWVIFSFVAIIAEAVTKVSISAFLGFCELITPDTAWATVLEIILTLAGLAFLGLIIANFYEKRFN